MEHFINQFIDKRSFQAGSSAGALDSTQTSTTSAIPPRPKEKEFNF